MLNSIWFVVFIMDLLAYCQHMSQRLVKADGIPECGCGMGKMEMRMAGRTAINAGRYYMKCPANLNHSGSFHWCDEYIRGMSGNSYIDERENIPRLGVERTPPTHTRLEHAAFGRHIYTGEAAFDLKTEFLIACVGIMMIVVGISIGKLV